MTELEHLRVSLAQLASEARRRQGGTHPDPADLVAYAARELQPAAAELVLEHLAVCRPCARVILGLPSFLTTSSQDLEEQAVDPEPDDSWRDLQDQLPAGSAAPLALAVGRDAGADRRPRARPSLRSVLALAACLAACLAGFPIWIAEQGRSRVPPPILAINPPEHALGETPSGAIPPPALRLDANAAAIVLYLPAPQLYPRLRVEILDRDGKTSSPAAAAPINPQSILVLLTRQQLPPGDYRLRVFGIESQRQRPLGDYPLRILAR